MPAPGIYAVSVGKGSALLRDMVVILEKSHGETEVLIHPYNREKIHSGQKTFLYFQKKVSGSVEPVKQSVISEILKSAIFEISDLIY